MAKVKDIVCVMHVPFEGPGIIAPWAKRNGIHMKFVRVFEHVPFPDLGENDMLLIMGGPMNVYDYHVHPWMEEEIEWVSKAISKGNPVLGICLGAQIIASALGVEVHPGDEKEIGWHPLQFLPAIGDYKIWKDHPGTQMVFHWHRDTFDIPDHAVRIAASEAFDNQGFIYKNRVVALQFHLEVTKESVGELVENCRDDIVPGPHVQSEEEIMNFPSSVDENIRLMTGILLWLVNG